MQPLDGPTTSFFRSSPISSLLFHRFQAVTDYHRHQRFDSIIKFRFVSTLPSSVITRTRAAGRKARMSFKGFQKSIVRAPQNFRSKFNIGENTKDAVYSDAERRFQELEKETKMLHSESKKYGDAINGMQLFSLPFSLSLSLFSRFASPFAA